jgi:hypothetical protein
MRLQRVWLSRSRECESFDIFQSIEQLRLDFASSKWPWTYRDLQKNWDRTGDTCFLMQVCWVVEAGLWVWRMLGFVESQLTFCSYGKLNSWLLKKLPSSLLEDFVCYLLIILDSSKTSKFSFRLIHQSYSINFQSQHLTTFTIFHFTITNHHLKKLNLYAIPIKSPLCFMIWHQLLHALNHKTDNFLREFN